MYYTAGPISSQFLYVSSHQKALYMFLIDFLAVNLMCLYLR